MNNLRRPLDEYGIPVDCGKTWYWAINRIGQIVGTGKFAWNVGNPQDPTFFINGTGYNPECFRYIPAAPPQFPGVCEILVPIQSRLPMFRNPTR